MQIKCEDLDRIFLDGSAEQWAGLEVHAASCPECAKELQAWKALGVAAEEIARLPGHPRVVAAN